MLKQEIADIKTAFEPSTRQKLGLNAIASQRPC